jgi:hypothetical protein
MFRRLEFGASRLGQLIQEFVSRGDLFAGKVGWEDEKPQRCWLGLEGQSLMCKKAVVQSCGSGYQNVDCALPFRALATPQFGRRLQNTTVRKKMWGRLRVSLGHFPTELCLQQQ